MQFIDSLAFISNDSVWLFVISFTVLSISALVGKLLFHRLGQVRRGTDDEAKLILGAALSLLGLLIGFTLSMAIGGYNSRQEAENAEAVAIRSVFMNSDLADATIRSQIKARLADYLQSRLTMYRSMAEESRDAARRQSLELQNEIWSFARQQAAAKPDPVSVVVLNSVAQLATTQQHTVAQWRHQIPQPAWVLLILVGVFCNCLIGYTARTIKKDKLIYILPFMISLSFMMIAEIDAPGRGLIHVTPVNLISLASALSV
ncbi:DUF4239 domain-containing protein [Brucella intermedia]|uniref:bestrophin-like domain n=1 Tax=Brucella intermedia TaxID=94625 RepID=UPI00124C3F37|nr:DUF4239 domain-containing protein [Brucella intermedia]KAB2722382.1 DUF4239 domain-containing protein [Brucella intermedia]